MTRIIERLPHGAGSIQKRRAKYWMIFRDLKGRVVQQNTGTDDRQEAFRVLARATLPYLRGKVAAVEAVANEGSTEAGPERRHQYRQPARNGRRHTSRGRSVRRNFAGR
jgi:hypothetical protein